jgi:hypothetical protein
MSRGPGGRECERLQSCQLVNVLIKIRGRKQEFIQGIVKRICGQPRSKRNCLCCCTDMVLETDFDRFCNYDKNFPGGLVD